MRPNDLLYKYIHISVFKRGVNSGMDGSANTADSYFLADEKFDFDVSLSPASSGGDEEEDEVFVGVVSHKERCISMNMELQMGDGSGSSWSPLTGDQLEAMCQEAHQLSSQLQSSKTPWLHRKVTDEAGEEFVQDTETKLVVLDQLNTALSPIKRQTFCVQDSPMKQLPSAVQQHLLRGNRAANMRSSALSAAARVSTSSPVGGAKPHLRMSLRRKSGLGVGTVLPSKLAAPTNNGSAIKTRATDKKTRLQPPSKVVGSSRLSLAGRPHSRVMSSEDLNSDSASMTSDVSDTSLNSSSVGRRILAPPTNNVMRNPSAIKAPPPQSRRVTDRRNTLSSSSSVSSFNSSLSVSPAAKVKLNVAVTGSNSRAPPSINKLSSHSSAAKPRSSISRVTTEPPGGAAGGRHFLSASARKLSEADRTKTARSTPLKRPETALHTPPHPPAVKRLTDRNVSITGSTPVPASRPKDKPKAQNLATGTPIGQTRVLSSTEGVLSPDVSRILKPKRLMSSGGVDSLPHKASVLPSEGSLTPSAVGNRMVHLKTRRPSALPTPLRRRTSAVSTATPNRPVQLTGPLPISGCNLVSDPAPFSARRESSCSPAHTDPKGEESVHLPDVQPFYLEEEKGEEPPSTSPSTTAQLDQSESTDSGKQSPDKAETDRNLIELHSTEEITKTKEMIDVLLLDLPAPTVQPQEKLLIDLTNTPDFIRTNNKTCTAAQHLIDLSSPLIKWSPDDKNENRANEAPLINLSF
ncbi:hypothetical protein LDENG_00088490 [Lucifuga dentata]|nr:hypothetical protein LDENG_00088490 [Lucifuga dentata]